MVITISFFYVIVLNKLHFGVSINVLLIGTPTSQTASVTGSCPASPAPMSHNHLIEEPVTVALITTSTPVSTTTVATISESISTISTVSTVVPSIISSVVAAPVRKKKDEIPKVSLL